MQKDRSLLTHDINGANSKRTIKNNIYYKSGYKSQLLHDLERIDRQIIKEKQSQLKEKTYIQPQQQIIQKDSLDQIKDDLYKMQQRTRNIKQTERVQTKVHSKHLQQDKQEQNFQQEYQKVHDYQSNLVHNNENIPQLQQHRQFQQTLQPDNISQQNYSGAIQKNFQTQSLVSLPYRQTNDPYQMSQEALQRRLQHKLQQRYEMQPQMKKEVSQSVTGLPEVKVVYDKLNNRIYQRQQSPRGSQNYYCGSEVSNLLHGRIPKFYPHSYQWYHQNGNYQLQPDVNHKLLNVLPNEQDKLNLQNTKFENIQVTKYQNHKKIDVADYCENRTLKNHFDFAGIIYGVK